MVTVSTIAWSTAGFFTRLIPLDSWTLLAWRGIFGALGVAIVMLVTERAGAWSSFRNMSWPGWLFAAVAAAGMILFITSLRYTTVAHAAVIYATIPFVAAGLGWLVTREKPTKSAVLASFGALAGVVVMVGFGFEGSPFGDLLAFGMTLTMAVMIVIARRFRSISSMPAAGLAALVSGLVCWPLGEPLAISGHELMLLIAFGLVNSAIGIVLFSFGARLLPAVETALIGSADAPLAPLWVWIAFGETPRANTIIGGLIVFAAVAIHLVSDASRKGARGRPVEC
jgi:drug/metabolite transporter (DMT)-like permease